MHSLSITLSHHLVFARKKKKFVYFLTLTTSIGESSVAVLQLKLNTGGVYRKYACTVAPEDTDMSC